ncbi:SOS response-associated peptidase [Vicingaceae bacterium]|nr:SOS response-associated peptidase [Vicingaceae bacterium]
MCGRFTLRTSPAAMIDLFEGISFDDITPRYNIAPTQTVAAVRDNKDSKRELAFLRWGLIPSWAKDKKIGNRMINARGETVAEKPSFRAAFKRRRCLILADGFYEWKKTTDGKVPHYVTMKNDRPFCFAGLWEYWNKADEPIESCTVITTSANELMEPIHDRMPVILSEDNFDMWLDPGFEGQDQLQSLIAAYPAEQMQAVPVSTHVNKPVNDDATCILPV